MKVRVIGQAPKLKNALPVRQLKGMKLHVRAIVRDGARVFLGSQSLRKLELDKRREVGLTFANRTVAQAILEVFDADWEKASTAKIEEREAHLT